MSYVVSPYPPVSGSPEIWRKYSVRANSPSKFTNSPYEILLKYGVRANKPEQMHRRAVCSVRLMFLVTGKSRNTVSEDNRYGIKDSLWFLVARILD
jgi:hypothetical protein